MSADVKYISDASFEADVVNSDKPVLVDFWAEWCGPCKAIGPIVEELATEYKDRLVVAKMNVDDNAEVPARFGIRGIPTLIIFSNGSAKAQQVGAVSKNQLKEFIDANI